MGGKIGSTAKTSATMQVVERKCGKCGRVFVPSPQHVYKAADAHGHNKVYCSWTCYAHRKDKTRADEERTREEITRKIDY